MQGGHLRRGVPGRGDSAARQGELDEGAPDGGPLGAGSGQAR